MIVSIGSRRLMLIVIVGILGYVSPNSPSGGDIWGNNSPPIPGDPGQP